VSYNITNDVIVKLDAKIDAVELERLVDDLASFVRVNWLKEHECDEPDAEGFVKLRNFDWSGEFSGTYYEQMIRDAAPHIKGVIEVVYVWESGDSFSGLRIEDGVATEMDVEFSLVPKKEEEVSDG